MTFVTMANDIAPPVAYTVISGVMLLYTLL